MTSFTFLPAQASLPSGLYTQNTHKHILRTFPMTYLTITYLTLVLCLCVRSKRFEAKMQRTADKLKTKQEERSEKMFFECDILLVYQHQDYTTQEQFLPA